MSIRLQILDGCWAFCLKNYRDLSICLTNMQMLSINRRNHISWKVCKLEKNKFVFLYAAFLRECSAYGKEYYIRWHRRLLLVPDSDRFQDTGDYSLSRILIDSKTPAINTSISYSRASCWAQHAARVATHPYIQIYSRIFAKILNGSY